MRTPLGLGVAVALAHLMRAQVPAAVGPPAVMHWCAQHCTTLTLDHGKPFDQVHYGSEAAGSLWIVERFTWDSVVIQRTDFRPFPGKATLTGRLSATGDSIVNGMMRWTYHPCCGLTAGKYEAAWGEAINSVPGTDQERAQRAAMTGDSPEGRQEFQLRHGRPSAAITANRRQVRRGHWRSANRMR